MANITQKFLSAICGFELRGGVLVAFSGGADSTALLKLFIEAKKSGDFGYEIAAAHLNHSLRGKEADRDEEFCRKFCEDNGVRFFAKTVDVAALAKREAMSTEEAAREVRYAFFREVLAGENRLSYVATAHNKEDFCETLIFNLVRGSGIDGLRSIPRVRDNIIRPMLDISRGEILDYLAGQGVKYVTDSTNLSDDYSRNKIRHHVLPALGEISAGYSDSICRTASLLSRDAEYLASAAEQAYELCVNGEILYTKKAQNLHLSILTRVIRMLYNKCGFSALAEAHLDALSEQIRCGKENFSLSLPGCVCICERGELRFAKDAPELPEFCIEAELEKEILLPSGISILLSRTQRDGATPLKADAISGRLYVRSRLEGDKITALGKTHKIKRMISDKKLNMQEKSKLFFLTDGEEILYTNLPAVSDKVFTKSGGGNCIFITTKETL